MIDINSALLALPPMAFYLAEKVSAGPLALLFPIISVFMLYVFTLLFAVFVRCKNKKLLQATKDSIKPIIPYMLLGLLMYVSFFVPIGLVRIPDGILNTLIMWFVVGYLLYRRVFDSVFEQNKC